MRTGGDYLALFHNDYRFTVLDGADPLRNRYKSCAVHMLFERTTEICVCFVIKGGGAVVKNENFGLCGDCASNQNTLLLPAGNVRSVLREHMSVALRESRYEVIRLSNFCGKDYLLVRNVPTEADIFLNRVRIEKVALHSRSEFAVKFALRYRAYVASAAPQETS